MDESLDRNIVIWIIGFFSYFIIGRLLNGFKYEGLYIIRIIFFLMFVLIIFLLYYINLELRRISYGEETNIFWKWTERFIPFYILFPIMTILFTFIIVGFTYTPTVAPFNYFINYCLGLIPFYFLVLLNDLSFYREYLRELWKIET